MSNESGPQQIVFTLAARCRDCYRCLRGCPVKAIRMKNGQAYVDEKRCIACGTCIRECPQQAKSFRQDVEMVQRLIESDRFVSASVAPSFAAVFGGWQRKRLPAALRALGFRYVGQTSRGAYHVSVQTERLMRENPSKTYVATACPAVVNYVEKYDHDAVGNLIPLASPMVTHARMLKGLHGKESAVVFIGPCVAKKSEILRPGVSGAVDCVLTFKELMVWLDNRNIDLSTCEESDFDEKPIRDAQLYPLPGGSIKTAAIEDDGLSLAIVRADGAAAVKESLDSIQHGPPYALLEPLFCGHGCINGPGVGTEKNIFERRRDIIEYNRQTDKDLPPGLLGDSKLMEASFAKEMDVLPPVSEGEIQAVLERTGKADPEQQLNCGACGYATCRDKAVAVVRGMAEPEMCIPLMRRLAERRTDRIIDTSPNGVVILDENLSIISMNPAFKHFFLCSEAVLGRHISYLMDPGPFEKLVSGVADELDITITHKPYNLLCRELLYTLKEERQIVGIFMNITSLQQQDKRLKELRSQTVEQANELLEHQVKMALNIAQFLGESTAKGEALVRKLMALSEGDEKESS
ncbi:MAG: [Fe-Fe] hydrogenase large subunit C-terminal domain-containing protein [Syntrophorhabdales bacterium]